MEGTTQKPSPKLPIPLVVALVALLGIGGFALAGSLTPSGAVSATMHTLAEVYDSIAGTFDSTSVVADQNGSLMENLKYIEANIGGASLWASNSFGIYETTRNIGIRTASPSVALEVVGLASASYVNVSSSSAGYQINGVTVIRNNGLDNIFVGAGAGPVPGGAYNTAVGYQALTSADTILANTAIGAFALQSTILGEQNTAVGYATLQSDAGGQWNTAIGSQALTNNLNASYNTAVGTFSLQENVSGERNTAVGYSALQSGDGSQNTAVGGWALQANDTGTNNTAVGLEALTRNTTGSNNSALGLGAAGAIRTGGFNTAFGAGALLVNQSGSDNVAVGASAGTSTLGSGNVFLGRSAGYSETGSNKLYISNSTTTWPLVYGDFGSMILAVSGSMGVGTKTPYAKLTVKGGGLAAESVGLASSSASILTPAVGFNGYTQFSGGIGTGGGDSGTLTPALRITNAGNLQNIGAIQAGQMLLTKGGTFATQVPYTTGSGPAGVALADVNRDGEDDIVTANANDATVSVILNAGSGTFGANVDYGTGTSPLGVSLRDVNGDGNVDIVTANEGANSVSVLMNKGNGTFATKVDYPTAPLPFYVVLGDVDGDGKPDIAASIVGGSDKVSVLLNRGDGTFAAKSDYSVGGSPRGIAMADVNGDGKLDIVTANFTSNTVSVLLNNGNGTFATQATYATGTNPWGLAVSDLNGDGAPDIVAVDTSLFFHKVSVLMNNGDGTFAAKVDYAIGNDPRNVALGDVNGDGIADIAVTDSSDTTVSVILNNGDGTFAARVTYATGATPSAVALADVNDDGKADMVVANQNGTSASVYVNQSSPMFFAQASTGNVGIGDSSPAYKLEIGTGGDINLASTSAGYRIEGVRILHNKGTANIWVGEGAGNSITSGIGNTALGWDALTANTTGAVNTAIGDQALLNNSSGGYNTAVGYLTLTANSTGNQNTAVGYNALGATTSSYNAAVGAQSLFANTTGGFNAALGAAALRMNLTGSDNVAVGASAGFSSLGSGNVFLGRSAGYSETGSNKLYIDDSNTASPLIYGDFSTNHLGFNGSASVSQDLEVSGSVIGFADGAQPGGVLQYTFEGDKNTGIGTFGTDRLAFMANSVYTVIVDSTGLNVLNGDLMASNSNSTESLILNPVGYADSMYTIRANGSNAHLEILGSASQELVTIASGGEVFAPGLSATSAGDDYVCRNPSTGELTFGTCTPSSVRFKTNIQDLSHGLDWVEQLRPVTFDWKHNGAPSLGLIAEEVASVSPLLAIYQNGQTYSVNYQILTAVLTKAIQEQQAEIDALNAGLASGSAGESDILDTGSESFARLFNAIVEGFRAILHIGFSDGQVTTHSLCLDDICVTKDELQTLLQRSHVDAVQPADTPIPTPTPSPAPTPAAEPSPSLTPTPPIESTPTPMPSGTPSATLEPLANTASTDANP